MVTVIRDAWRRSLAGCYYVTTAVAGLVLCLSLASDAFGQRIAPAPPGLPDPREGRHAIETIRIWKMTEALNLDEEQAAKLFPRLAQLEASRREFHRQQRLLRDELTELLKQRPLRDQEVKARLEQLERAEVDFRGREQAIKGGLRLILSVEQQARLALFEDRFETEMRRIIQDLRQRHRGIPPGQGQRIESPAARDLPPPPIEGESQPK